MIKKLDWPLILLAVAGFLSPLIGGQVSVDALSAPQGSDPWLAAITGSSDAPMLSHALLGLLVTAVLVSMLLQRKIVQVPNNTVGTIIVVLLALILSTIGYSSFRGVSIPAAVEWLMYGVAFFAVVATAGRQRGPKIILASIFAGCVVLGWLGIKEYGDNRFLDPSWRVSPQWIGPNAVAAILDVGLILGIGFAVIGVRGAQHGRIITALASLGCVAIGLGLFLTGSKGALAAFAVCLLVFLTLLGIWLPRKEAIRSIAVSGAIVGSIVLLSALVALQPKPTVTDLGTHTSATTAQNHILSGGASAEQSVEFRKLLWQSAIKLMEINPIGIGIGAFQYESARPGLVTQTHLAHDTYLDLGTEASAVAPLLLLAAFAAWTRLLMRGGSKLRAPQNILRASVFAATLVIFGHSLVDSDFSYFGIGLVTFMLMGIGHLLSADAVAPEFVPPLMRKATAAGISALALFMLYLGFTEASRAQAKGDLPSAINDARVQLDGLRSSAPWDGEVWAISTLVTEDPAQRLTYARKAVDLAPSTRNLRMLARVSASQGLFSDALGALRRTIELDPNNMEAFKLQADIEEQMGDEAKAVKSLQDLISVEKTPYFKVRSLPELVVTTTYEARVRLAAKTADDKAKIDLLQPAIDGFKQYLTFTVSALLRYAKLAGKEADYGGENLDLAKKKMSIAAEAAKTLAAAYRATGEPGKAEAAEADAGTFATPLEPPATDATAPSGKGLDLPSSK